MKAILRLRVSRHSSIRTFLRRFLFVSCVVLGTAFTTEAADFYVSPDGNDNATGNTPDDAWLTIDRVNLQSLQPGDRVLFEGGQTFTGHLGVWTDDVGSATNPIVIGSYGTGRATIAAASDTKDAIIVYNTPGVTINNLNVVGPGAATSTHAGICFLVDLPGNVALSHAYVDSVDVTGFYRGISAAGWNGGTGWDDLRLTNVSAHGNAEYGIYVFAATKNANRNVYVGHCKAYDNAGRPGQTWHNGNGIVVSCTNGGTIERCVAYNNGYLCTSSGGGPVGIWAHSSNDITIQYNESYNNSTGNGFDGGGFDLDIDTTNSVMQYNYSHGNAGAGFLVYDDGGTWCTNNVVRYNITENDGRKNGFGAIYVAGFVDTTEVYGNVVYLSRPSTGNPPAVYVGSVSRNAHFRNNVFMTAGGVPLVRVAGAPPGIAFQGNSYFSQSGSFVIGWGSTSYSSLGAWRAATGQERLDGSDIGIAGDPMLVDAGNGGTVGDADALAELSAYRLQAGSPLIDAGLDLTVAPFSLQIGSNDFYGNDLPQGGSFDVGAQEFTSAPGLAAPTNLQAVGSESQIALEWTASAGAALYDVKRATASGGPYATVESGVAGTAYVDMGLPAGNTFYYVVAASDGSVVSPDSAEVAATVPEDELDLVEFAVSNVTLDEGATAMLTIVRTGACTEAASVAFATSDGTATAGADFTASSGTLSFAPGEMAKTVTISTLDDTVGEGPETFEVVLTPVDGCALGTRATAVTTITDNDPTGIFEFSADLYSASESTARLTIKVTRSRNAAGPASVTWAAASNTAALGADATAAGGVLMFGNSETTKTFFVDLINDTLAEGNESIFLRLENPSGGAVLGVRQRAVLTIVDNDATQEGFKFAAASYSRPEPGAPTTVSLTVSRPNKNKMLAQTVFFTVRDGTATASEDFAGVTLQAVTFAPGQLSKTVSVELFGDMVAEGNECINLEITDSTGGSTLGVQRRVVMVLVDDDYTSSV
jgi:hypothetical protein